MNIPNPENYPKTYEAYLELCNRRGIEQRLDKETFETVTAIQGKPTKEAIESAMNKSEEELLINLGASLHLDELVNPGKPAE